MRANFSDLTYHGGEQKSCCASKGCGQTEPWLTAEQIPVKGSYSANDLEEMEHLNYAAGIAPKPLACFFMISYPGCSSSPG